MSFWTFLITVSFSTSSEKNFFSIITKHQFFILVIFWNNNFLKEMITKRMNIKQISQLILRFKIMPSPCNEILVLKNYLHHAHFSFRTWRACAYITYWRITIRVGVFSRYFTHTHLAYFKTGLVIYAVFLSLTRGQFLQKIQYEETS